MTMPRERTRAVQSVKDFLYTLLDPKKTPRVPSAVRKEAGRLLKHYPGTYDLKVAADKAPTVWGSPDWGLIPGVDNETI